MLQHTMFDLLFIVLLSSPTLIFLEIAYNYADTARG